MTVRTESDDPALAEIEVTTYRAEGKYTDKRHPDEVRFASTLEEDLSLRDFTINAMAARLINMRLEITDPFGGQKDLKNKCIRAVGEPTKRFEEDALRMIRAVRFAARFEFEIDAETAHALGENAAYSELVEL